MHECVCLCVCPGLPFLSTLRGGVRCGGAWLLLQAVHSPYRFQCLISERPSILFSTLIGKSRVRLQPLLPPPIPQDWTNRDWWPQTSVQYLCASVIFHFHVLMVWAIGGLDNACVYHPRIFRCESVAGETSDVWNVICALIPFLMASCPTQMSALHVSTDRLIMQKPSIQVYCMYWHAPLKLIALIWPSPNRLSPSPIIFPSVPHHIPLFSSIHLSATPSLFHPPLPISLPFPHTLLHIYLYIVFMQFLSHHSPVYMPLSVSVTPLSAM